MISVYSLDNISRDITYYINIYILINIFPIYYIIYNNAYAIICYLITTHYV